MLLDKPTLRKSNYCSPQLRTENRQFNLRSGVKSGSKFVIAENVLLLIMASPSYERELTHTYVSLKLIK